MIGIDHAINGDRVLITVELPTESVTSVGDTVAVTMDDREWHDVARRVLREGNAAEVGLDPGIVVLRVEQALREAAEREIAAGSGPGQARRAAAAVLSKLSELVLGGTLRGFNVEWHAYEPGELPSVCVWFKTRRLAGEVTISLVREQAVAQ